MVRLSKFILLFLLVFMMACSDDVSSASSPDRDSSEISFAEDSLHRDFVRINAAGHYTYLGTNKEGVPLKERHAMKVYFDYDFSISNHEITQQEFASALSGSAAEGEENYPITNLTYGDVIFYANQKSKQEGFDTVYSYSRVIFDTKHVVGFEKLNFNAEVAGYRLPTEAEWTLVASMDWNPDSSWNGKNSENAPHEVCSRGKNTLGICDIAGNVAEWVNDYAGCFKDTSVSNFVGAPNGGSVDERVIKGGSFRTDPKNMYIYSRGDVYTVSTSTFADYVGARLAFGPIPSPEWMNGCGSTESAVRSLVNSGTIKEKLGTRRAKLAFVNRISENLAFVNYNENNYSVVEIADSLPVKHPDISPDGEWVAFCTGEEGVDSRSELYVRRLNSRGTDLKKLDVESAAIPRFRVTPDGDTVITYVDNSRNNKDESSFLKTSTWQVPFRNGKFGTPKKLFDGAYHGGISENLRLAVSGARILRARRAMEKSGTVLDNSAQDTVWLDGEQTCNVSLSTDGTNRTLYLDFGSKKENYGVHERLLILDSLGKQVQGIPSPEKYSFDHTEWVRNRNLAVATVADINGLHPKVVLVDLEDSSVTDLVRGDELMHPCLWLNDVKLSKEESFLDLDSAGVYMTAFPASATVVMRIKMELFWKYKDSTEVAIIGSSRSYCGVDPEEVKSMFAVNYAYAAEDMTATHFFIRNYFLPSMPNLKAIVLALDYDRFWIGNENWKNWFGDIPGYKYDENHDFWKDGAPESMYELTKNALAPSEDEYFLADYRRGLHHSLAVGYNQETPDLSNDKDWFDKLPEEYSYNLDRLEEILAMAQEKNVQVIGVVFPQSPLYKTELNVWGRYGLSFDDVQKIQGDMAKLKEKYDNFTIMDEYKNGSNDYAFGDFANDDHLGLFGAEKLTKRLDSLLVDLSKR
ncbi:MAG: TIGR02171 family protein [Fibrobacter sp.]|nr:TIGR02171 family protein [Fibrobacter sp.]